ncbi:M15 family metallopeptidase [Bosea sp. BH3]|uniref:M15 family metallopeptidase n=1 Tax=Bosea sp. BH3 TaxID=2871701 RepID=UPI0021CAE8AF|nr:M15 family metallopeptidase [Bosea sp. BH3]MCU4180187.1 M15 family metallopeptidase [Bosea sp. BH3]
MSSRARVAGLKRISLVLTSLAWVCAAHSQPGAFGPGGVYAKIPIYDEFGRDQIAMFRAWNPDPVGNHDAKLRALDPVLSAIVRRAQESLPDLRFVIGSGRRDRDEQAQAVAWGWSRTRSSAHRSGRAVDIWPLDGEGRVVFDPARQVRIATAMRKAASDSGVRLRWGGHFGRYKDNDRSHFELATRRQRR